MNCLKPRSKLNHIKPTVAADEAVVYCPMSDYEKTMKIDLITSGTCVTS